MLTIRNSNMFVKNGQKVMKNGNFIPKWGVNDHQMCHVKIFVTPKAVIYNNGPWSFQILVVLCNCN